MVVEAEELARRMRQKMEDVRFADKTIMGQIYYDYGEIDLIDDAYTCILSCFGLFIMPKRKGVSGVIDVHSEEYILGQNIKKYRALKNWTQGKLSEVVNIDRAEISKYESGQNGEMGFKMLKRFAKAFLFTGDAERPEEQMLLNSGVRLDATVSQSKPAGALCKTWYAGGLFFVLFSKCSQVHDLINPAFCGNMKVQ